MDESLKFSPVEVPQGAPLSGNLTGNARRIKDSCSDFYNCIQNWNESTIKGHEKLKEIAYIKFKDSSDSELFENNGSHKAKLCTENSYNPQLQELCNDLEDIAEQMKEVVSKMERIVEQLKVLCELVKLKQDNSSGDALSMDIVFQTWPVEKFYLTTKEITNMYRKELKCKLHILQEVCHLRKNSSVVFFITYWSHQAFIERKGELLLKAIVIECGLKR